MTMTFNKGRAGLLAISALFALAMFTPMVAFASKDDKDDKDKKKDEVKVMICHANTSNENSNKPYTVNNVDANGLNGHGDHEGDGPGVAWNSTIHEQFKDDKFDWGDIISPTDLSPDGLNWDKYGQAVYKNDCKYVKAVTPTKVDFVAPTCDALGSYIIPATEGVIYKVNNAEVKAGTYTSPNGTTVTVTAEALKGFVLEGTTSWTETFTAPTDCDDDGDVLDDSVVAVVTPTPTTPTSLPNTGNSVATIVALMTAVSAGAAMFSTTLRSALIKFNS